MKDNNAVVGVFGHYGNHNLGDEAIIQASISQIRKRLPGAEVCCFSLRPRDTARRHQVESYGIRFTTEGSGPIQPEEAPPSEHMPWNVYAKKLAENIDPDDFSLKAPEGGLKEKIKRLPLIWAGLKALSASVDLTKTVINEVRYLTSSYRYLKKFDLIVISGSNQFLDNFGGAWGFPYTLYKWSLLAKLTGTKTAFVSVGTNPLEHPLSKKFIHKALRMSSYLSYRDEASKALIEEGNVGFSGELYPDLAFGLDFQPADQEDMRLKPLVGINPMPVYDYRYWCVSDDGRYKAYVVKLARFAERLITDGHPILFFGTMWRDDYVIVDILKEMNSEICDKVDGDELVRHCEEVADLVTLLQEVDMVVATRFHGTVLPLLVHTPVIGISYYRKNVDLMDVFKQSDYYEVLEECDVDRLWDKLQLLSKNYVQEKEKIRDKTEEFQCLVEEQWDRVINLINR
jgi:polysaccharide pyruvyl transferase WcaK-like protein